MTQKLNTSQKQQEKRLQTLRTQTIYIVHYYSERKNSHFQWTESALVTIEKRKPTYTHRSRIDIIAHILDTTQEGAKKTHIMYQCNLSYRQLQGYLTLLDEMQLIKKDPKNPATYQPTQKGKNFTKAYKNIKAILNSPS